MGYPILDDGGGPGADGPIRRTRRLIAVEEWERPPERSVFVHTQHYGAHAHARNVREKRG